LSVKGHNALEYHSDLDSVARLEREQMLLDKLKALVSTVALGMCFDKPVFEIDGSGWPNF
jgi:superfamily II DNA helicase RecQ